MNYSDISYGTDANDSVTFGNIINDTFYVSPDLPPWVCIFSIEVLLLLQIIKLSKLSQITWCP